MNDKDFEKFLKSLPLVKKGWTVGTNFSYYIDQNNTETILADTEREARKEYCKQYYYNLDTGEGYINVRAKRNKDCDKYLFENEAITRYTLYEKLAYREYQENTKKLVFENKGKECHIYSSQHHAYWGYNKSGYVDGQENAGVYSIEEAGQILLSVGLEKKLKIIFRDKEKHLNYLKKKIDYLNPEEKKELLQMLNH